MDTTTRNIPMPPAPLPVAPGRETMAIVAEWVSRAPATLLAEVEHITAACDRIEEIRVEWSRRPGVGSVAYRKGSSLVLDVHGDDGRHWCVIRAATVRVVDFQGVALPVTVTGRADDYGN